MSPHVTATLGTKPMRTRVVASVAAIAMSGIAVVGSAVPAQARPRSCANISQSMEFFYLAMQMDTGASAGYWATDNRMYNYEIGLYNRAGC
jgi:hypothetical protein